jgi:hypothetical protein
MRIIGSNPGNARVCLLSVGIFHLAVVGFPDTWFSFRLERSSIYMGLAETFRAAIGAGGTYRNATFQAFAWKPLVRAFADLQKRMGD